MATMTLFSGQMGAAHLTITVTGSHEALEAAQRAFGLGTPTHLREGQWRGLCPVCERPVYSPQRVYCGAACAAEASNRTRRERRKQREADAKGWQTTVEDIMVEGAVHGRAKQDVPLTEQAESAGDGVRAATVSEPLLPAVDLPGQVDGPDSEGPPPDKRGGDVDIRGDTGREDSDGGA